ncbi:MAG: ABC transporter permease [Planctomycetes bacterium]|nr:ABC transporter permease [Planctomycetota bacterium]
MSAALAQSVGRLGRLVLGPVVTITSIAHLVAATAASVWRQRASSQQLVLRETVRQVRAVGVQTLPSVTQLGFLVGMIAAMQMINLLAEFTGTAKVWNLLVLVIFREVAPLLTAIIVAGRSGTVVAADLANMVVAEELDALETMGINPLHYAVLPRAAALVVSTLALIFYFVAAALAGAAIVSRLSLSLPFSFFATNILQSVSASDVAIFTLKGAVFGLVIASVAAWQGLAVERSRDEIPRAVSRATFQSLAACVLCNSLFSLFLYFKLSHLYYITG